MKEYLVMISIGPVQDFIASARKLRDLWFGSQMLSELSKVVAKSLYDQNCELIFPCVESVDELQMNSDLIVANKVCAKFSGENVGGVVKNAEIALNKAQTDYAMVALEKIRQIKSIAVNEELYQRQIGDACEFFAAWTELDENYKDCRNKLAKTLAARKLLRNFEAPSWDGRGLRKSSLDGARETVFLKRPKEIIGLLKKNEYLDTLGCIKRFYPIATRESPHFEDLSDIALMPYLRKIHADDRLKSLLNDYEACFSAGNGARSSYSKRHTNTELSIISDLFYAGEEDLKHLNDNGKAWRALKRLTSKDAAGEPTKYACVLLGDGDKMGIALDGIATCEGHQAFSRALGGFAKEVEAVIQKHDGSLIYAGGDDVMAYLPLHTALDASNEIRLKFQECLADVFNRFNLMGAAVPTFSIGLAIVHHSTPLDKALATARKAEKLAKNNAGRDALAVIQSKRNGSEIAIYGKWTRNDDRMGLYERIDKMIRMYNDESGVLHHSLGYQLRQAANECGDEILFKTNGDSLIPENAAAVAVTRIFEQKLKCGGGENDSGNLKSLLNGRGSIRRLSNELVVARQIAETIRISNSTKEVR